MAVESWTEEELEEYYENPHLFIVRANRMRSRMICDLLLKRVQKSMERLDNVVDHADELKRRAQMLADRAEFPSSQDAVPNPASVAVLIKFDASGMPRESELDMISENYWGIKKVFSR